MVLSQKEADVQMMCISARRIATSRWSDMSGSVALMVCIQFPILFLSLSFSFLRSLCTRSLLFLLMENTRDNSEAMQKQGE
jgi:hypothetical protein